MSQHREGADVTAAPNSRAGSITAPQQNTHMLGTHPLTDSLAEAPPHLELLLYSKPYPSTGVSYTNPKGHSLLSLHGTQMSLGQLCRGGKWSVPGPQFEVDSNWMLKLQLQPLVAIPAV